MIRSTTDRTLALTLRDSRAALARCALAVALVACGDTTDLKPVTPGEVGGGAGASGGASPAGNGGAAQKAGMGGTSNTGGAAPSVGGAAGKGSSGGPGAGASSTGGASGGASGTGGASGGASGTGGASAGASGTGGASAGASGAGGEAHVLCPPILDPTPVTCGPGGSGVGTKCSEPDTACYFIDGSSGNPGGGSGGAGGSGAAGGSGGNAPVTCLPSSDPSLLDLLPNHPFICGSNVSEVKGPPVCRTFTAGAGSGGHGPSPACCYKVKYVGVCA